MGKSNRVEDTTDSSTASKLSMTKAGYISNEMYEKTLEWFVKYERRTSLINRGYYIRVVAIQRLLQSFLQAHKSEGKVQIVNLGAGFDALLLALLLADSHESYANCEFVEVDFDNVMNKKANIIRAKLQLEKSDSNRIFQNYILIGCDLMDAKALECKLVKECNLKSNIPTLVIAECVLNYLPAENADEVLKTMAGVFQKSSFIVYEQIEPLDKFGQTMLKHFASIKSPLLSIDTYPSVQSHLDRYTKLGFPAVDCWTIGHLYCNMLDADEHKRIAKLEMFDEYEMWHAKCAHYVVTVASTAREQQTRLLQQSHIPCFGISTDVTPSTSVQCAKHPLDISVGQLRRFAHKSALFERSIDNKRHLSILSLGGWSIGTGNRHGRAQEPCLLDLTTYFGSTLDVSLKSDTDNPSDLRPLMERCYHSMTPVLDGKTVFVFGGRRSPADPLTLSCLLRLTDAKAIEVECISGDGPCGRWRHAAVNLSIGGTSDSVFVCGGITERTQVLSDCWLFTLDNRVWRRLPDFPIGVHSHSICWDSKNRWIMVIGGLMMNEQICTMLQLYSIDQNAWVTLEVPSALHRYGAMAFMISDNTVAVIGGALPDLGECHNIAIFGLEFDHGQKPKIGCHRVIDLSDTSDFILMNHDAIFDELNRRIFVFGGGGNCFSFGTCFNDYVLEIDVTGLMR